MYIEYEINSVDDLVYLIENEAFAHLTKDEAADLVLKIINHFFSYYKEIS